MSFERQNHVVNGRWCDFEVPPKVSFRRCASIQLRICHDEREVLALFLRERLSHIPPVVSLLVVWSLRSNVSNLRPAQPVRCIASLARLLSSNRRRAVFGQVLPKRSVDGV